MIAANPPARDRDGLPKWIMAKSSLDEHGETRVVCDESGTIKGVAQSPQVGTYRAADPG